jgi:hypothetical protein
VLADFPIAAVLQKKELPKLSPPTFFLLQGIGPYGLRIPEPEEDFCIEHSCRDSLLLSVYSTCWPRMGLYVCLVIFLQTHFWHLAVPQVRSSGTTGVTLWFFSELSLRAQCLFPVLLVEASWPGYPMAQLPLACLPACTYSLAFQTNHMPSAAGEVSQCHSSPSSFAVEDLQKCKGPPSLQSHAVCGGGRGRYMCRPRHGSSVAPLGTQISTEGMRVACGTWHRAAHGKCSLTLATVILGMGSVPLIV